MDLSNKQIYAILNGLLPSAKHCGWYKQLLDLVNTIGGEISPSKCRSKNSVINDVRELNLIKAYIIIGVFKGLLSETGLDRRTENLNIYTRIGGKPIFKTFTDEEFTKFRDKAISVYQKQTFFNYKWGSMGTHTEDDMLVYDAIPAQCKFCEHCKVDIKKFIEEQYLTVEYGTVDAVCSNVNACPHRLITVSRNYWIRVKRLMLTRLFDKIDTFVSILSDDDWNIILIHLYEINPKCRDGRSSGISMDLKKAFEFYITTEYLRFDPAMATQISKYIEKYGTN